MFASHVKHQSIFVILMLRVACFSRADAIRKFHNNSRRIGGKHIARAYDERKQFRMLLFFADDVCWDGN